VDHVVLGGTYAVLAGHLRDRVAEQLGRRVLAAPWSTIDIGVATAGQYPAMTGGALAVLRAYADEPAAWSGEDVPASS
jgi:hypothetical protein